ncbi:MAG: trehalose-phosphatase [Polyangiaceae bacterium]
MATGQENFRAPRRPKTIFLDYDGTLVPFAEKPELAMPDAALFALLSSLAELEGSRVHIVSGRTRDSLDRWLGALPIGLHAEHGFWSRLRPGERWTSRSASVSWMESVRELMKLFAARAPGAWIEEKTASLAWHYRLADPTLGRAIAKELRDTLARRADFDVLDGVDVVEARAHGVNKGAIVPEALRSVSPDAELIAIGDDQTDEDLFAALPPNASCYRVGEGATRATHRLRDVAAVRALLSSFLPTEDSTPS